MEVNAVPLSTLQSLTEKEKEKEQLFHKAKL